MTVSKWTKIWESDDYQVEIYDNCTTRVYKHEEKEKIKIELDGTRWVGYSGSFHVYQYFIDGAAAVGLKELIGEYDNGEASDQDVERLVESLAR